MWEKKAFFKLICTIVTVIFLSNCYHISRGNLISTEQQVNRNEVLGYKYQVEKIKYPSLKDPTMEYKIVKMPIYKVQDVLVYEKVKRMDFLRTTITFGISGFCLGALAGMVGNLKTNNQDASAENSKVNPIQMGLASAAVLSILPLFGIFNKQQGKKVGEIRKPGKSYIDSSNSFQKIPAVNIPVQFESDDDGVKNSFKAQTDDQGIVKINLIDDLKIKKSASDQPVNVLIKFMNIEANKFETTTESLEPLWLTPYTIVNKSSPGNVYKEPSENSEKLMLLDVGKKAFIQEIFGDWFKVSIGDTYGWIPKASGNIQYVTPEYVELQNPPFLETKIKFDDSNSERPNGILDGYEKAKLIAHISNKEGKGRAISVKLSLLSSNTQVTLNKEISAGTIDPGEEKQIEIPIAANLRISDDTVSILVETIDKNDNEAPPVKFNLPVKSIPLPDLDIKRIEVNDEISGLAKGNGNGKIENGETIEIVSHIENKGPGEAQDITVKIKIEDPQIKGIAIEQSIPRINSGKTEKTIFAISVPRTYKNKFIKTEIVLKEGRGACELIKENPLNVYLRTPRLSYETLLFDGNSAQSKGNRDGKFQQGELLELKLNIKNGGELDAENVIVNVESPLESIIPNKTTEKIGTIRPESGPIPVSFILNVQRKTIPGEIKIPIKLIQGDFPDVEGYVSFEIQKGSIKEVSGEPLFIPQPVKPKITPYIIIGQPLEGDEPTYDSEIRISGQATDDEKVENIEVKVNDQLLDAVKVIDLAKVQPSKMAQQREFEFVVALPQIGENKIEIIATDNEGLSNTKEIIVKRIPINPETWIVAIGINNYENNNIHDLKYSVNDANEIYNYFTNNLNIPEDHAYKRLEDKATLKEIKSVLGNELNKKVKEIDTVIIFYAGHGSIETDPANLDGDNVEKYLLPYDADMENQYATAFPVRDIEDIFSRIKSKILIFIIDSCFSGAAETGVRTQGLTRGVTSPDPLRRLAKGEGRVILTASGANQLALEKEEYKHGVFTYFLLKGLNGDADSDKDGLISIEEISHYIKKEVGNETNNRQIPKVVNTTSGLVILGKIKEQK